MLRLDYPHWLASGKSIEGSRFMHRSNFGFFRFREMDSFMDSKVRSPIECLPTCWTLRRRSVGLCILIGVDEHMFVQLIWKSKLFSTEFARTLRLRGLLRRTEMHNFVILKECRSVKRFTANLAFILRLTDSSRTDIFV